MAKKVTTTRVFSDTDDEPETTPQVISQPVPDEWAALKSKLSAGKGARIKLYRQTPKGRQFCRLFLPSEIESEETIREFHAASLFAHEEGHYWLGLETDGVMNDPFEMYIAPQTAKPVDGIQGSQYGTMAEQRIMQRLEDMDRRINTREQTPMVEMVHAMAELDKLRGGNKQEMSVDTILKCIELGQGMGPRGAGGDWTDKLVDAVKDNAPLLLSIFQRMQQQPGQAPQLPQLPPVEQPSNPVIDQPVNNQVQINEEERRNQEMLDEQMLKATLTYLKKRALANSDPGLYIDLVIDDQENPAYAKLISEIADNDFSSFAAKHDPDIEKPQYRQFFSVIYNGLRSVIVRSDSMAAAGGRKAGNETNASSNGTAGKGSKK